VNRIGIMQGRLVPPIGDVIQAFPARDWSEEFPLAAAAELSAIEWIYDAPDHESNPLATDDGVARIRQQCASYGVDVRSVCADYFMAVPLLRVSGPELSRRIDHLAWLIERASVAGIQRIVLPFVDASGIHTECDRDQVVEVMHSVADGAARAGIELHVESALAPAPFADLLDRIAHGIVKVNYDTGNSASLGYDPDEEFAAYGEMIGSVHIKDRVRGGGTVPLGSGDADLPCVFANLLRSRYQGDLILQVARGIRGDELAWARRNRNHVLTLMA
jgi:L-ribulose-5-phosphate 3-epimerase